MFEKSVSENFVIQEKDRLHRESPLMQLHSIYNELVDNGISPAMRLAQQIKSNLDNFYDKLYGALYRSLLQEEPAILEEWNDRVSGIIFDMIARYSGNHKPIEIINGHEIDFALKVFLKQDPEKIKAEARANRTDPTDSAIYYEKPNGLNFSLEYQEDPSGQESLRIFWSVMNIAEYNEDPSLFIDAALLKKIKASVLEEYKRFVSGSRKQKTLRPFLLRQKLQQETTSNSDITQIN